MAQRSYVLTGQTGVWIELCRHTPGTLSICAHSDLSRELHKLIPVALYKETFPNPLSYAQFFESCETDSSMCILNRHRAHLNVLIDISQFPAFKGLDQKQYVSSVKLT